MKQIITITVLILISIIMGCSNNTKASGSGNNSTCVYYADKGICQVHLIKVRGHEYLVSYTNSGRGGTCIIHAAHCSCNNH